MLDYETDMLCLDEGDMDLIHACASRLDELNGPAMSDEEFLAAIKKAEEEYVSSNTNTLPVRTVKRRLASKKIWLVAAVIALLVAMATVTASAFGVNVFEYFREVMGLSAGEKVNKGTITLVNYGEAQTFSSVEELLSAENLNILYPAVLPEDVVIQQVCINEGTNGGDFIQFVTTDKSTYISVDTNTELTYFTDYTEQHTIGDCTYYIYRNENFAVCYHKGCYYYISSDSYENLIIIIENMRENK